MLTPLPRHLSALFPHCLLSPIYCFPHHCTKRYTTLPPHCALTKNSPHSTTRLHLSVHHLIPCSPSSYTLFHAAFADLLNVQLPSLLLPHTPSHITYSPPHHATRHPRACTPPALTPASPPTNVLSPPRVSLAVVLQQTLKHLIKIKLNII